MKQKYYLIFGIIVLVVVGIILISNYEEQKNGMPDMGFGPCYLHCTGIIYDSNSTVETKTEARIVFDQYLKQKYPELPLIYDVDNERGWEIAQNPELNISNLYYYVLPNCTDLLNKMPELKSNIPGVCTRLAVTSNGKICSTGRGPC